MRKVKCRICSKMNDKDVAYKYVHTTSTGKEVNMYYCSEEEFLEFKTEQKYREKFEEKFNDIMKYTVINSYTRKLYGDIQSAGYSNKEIYNCLVEKESDIIRALNYKRNIKDENIRIKYAFAIIKNGMFDVTIKKRQEEKLKQINEKKEQHIENVDFRKNRKDRQERKGLLDIIGGR